MYRPKVRKLYCVRVFTRQICIFKRVHVTIEKQISTKVVVKTNIRVVKLYKILDG